MKYITQIDPKQVVRFVFAAIPGVAAYYLIYYILFKAGIQPATSVIIATVIKRLGVFMTQKLWTFKNDDMRATLWQIPIYFTVYTGIAFLNGASVWLLIEQFQISKLTAPLYPILPFGVLSFLVTRGIFHRPIKTET